MNNIGDTMAKGRDKALKSLAVLMGLLVYAGALLYSAVHNYGLLTRGVEAGMIPLALLGVVALELTALALPLALHYWTFAPMQRLAAFAFYALDMLLVVGNVVTDFAMTAGEALPGWLLIYVAYAAPAAPVIMGLGLSVLLLLDTSSREKALTETLRAATRESLAGRIAEQARSADISQAVEVAAAELTRQIVNDTLGVTVKPASPVAPATAGNNHHEKAAALADTVPLSVVNHNGHKY